MMYDCSGTFINVWRDGKAIADLMERKEGVEIFFLSVHNKMTLNVPWTPIHPTPNWRKIQDPRMEGYIEKNDT